MLNVKEDKGEINLRKLQDKKKELNQIIETLINFLCIHIKNQINAGADVIQIFDSWAGLIPTKNLNDYCYTPNAKILNFCRKQKIPTICFPKGIRERYEDFNKIVKPDGINLDPEIDPAWAREKLKNVVIQGGLNPNILLKDDEDIIKGATKYIRTFKDIPYVFNLGHGLLPETDPDKVSRLIKFYRNFNG